MNKIRTLIVDDEPYARKKISRLLKNDGDFEIIGECENGNQARAAIDEMRPDLVFLDIQMPEMTGFEVLESLESEQLPLIVFVTAFDQFAVAAFEAHALDYLLKPFDLDRMQKTLKRVRERVSQDHPDQLNDRVKQMINQMSVKQTYPDRLMIKSDGEIYFVKVDKIDWIEAAGNYVNLYIGEKSHLLRETMDSIAKKLNPDHFARIHRSQIVNIDRIKRLVPDHHGDYFIVMQDNRELTLTRTYRDNLFKRFGKS